MDADRRQAPTGNGAASATGAEDADPSQDDEGGQSFIARFFGFGGGDRAEEDGGRDDGARTAGERAMLLNVRRLRELRVIDVMVPRADIEAVDLESDLDTLVGAFRRTRHTRLPVYRETLDDPLGFIHLKDLALRFGFNGHHTDDLDLRPLVRPMLYVPPSMPIDALLQKMQGGRIHMALVIDEYGGVDGLVTIEDVLEQIVGDIEDEHDVADAFSWREEAPGVYIVSARMEVPEFEAAVDTPLLGEELEEDVDTLGGLVFMLADRVPERGELILHPDGHEFEVLDADPRRIKRLRVRLRPAVARARAGADEGAAEAEAAPRAAQ